MAEQEEDSSAKAGTEVRAAGSRLRTVHVQQHADHHDRPERERRGLGSAGSAGFKGSRKSTPYAAQMAAEAAARRADGARPAAGRGLREGAGQRPRGRHPLAAGGGDLDPKHPRRDADTAQRLPAAEAAPRIDGALAGV